MDTKDYQLMWEIVKLLPSDKQWTRHDRDAWLHLVGAALDLLIETAEPIVITVKPRKLGRPRKLDTLNRPTLYELYINQRLTTYQIAEQHGVSPQLIQLRLRQYRIPRRLHGI